MPGKKPEFWYVAGIFSYYTCSFLVFITFDYLANKGLPVGRLWRFHNVIMLVLCIYFSKGILCLEQRKK